MDHVSCKTQKEREEMHTHFLPPLLSVFDMTGTLCILGDFNKEDRPVKFNKRVHQIILRWLRATAPAIISTQQGGFNPLRGGMAALY